MDPVAQRSEALNAAYTRMLSAPLQPKSGIEPVPPDDRAGKPDPSLKDNAGFLRVYRDRPAAPRGGEPSPEDPAEQRRLACEMAGETVTAARMPKVAADEPMAAFRASPEGCWTFGQANAKIARF